LEEGLRRLASIGACGIAAEKCPAWPGIIRGPPPKKLWPPQGHLVPHRAGTQGGCGEDWG